MVLMDFLPKAWQRLRAPDPPPTGHADPWPTPELTAPLAQRVATWFAQESTEEIHLALETVAMLWRASPRVIDPTRALATPTAWLSAVLDALAALPEPLPIPATLPVLPWRYLIFTRMAADALENAYSDLGQRRIATHCPLTLQPDPHPAPRRLAPPSGRAPLRASGLGALLVGARFSDAGQRRIYAAQEAGVNWCEPSAFWALLQPVATPVAAPAPTPLIPPEVRSTFTNKAARLNPLPLPSPVMTDDATRLDPQSTPPTPSPNAALSTPVLATDARSAPAPRRSPEDQPRRRTPQSPSRQRVPSSGPETALCAEVRAALSTLVLGPGFNHQAGDLWFCGDVFWVLAQVFAHRLEGSTATESRCALQHRRWLYTRMTRQGLLLLNGAEPVWQRFVADPGQQQPLMISVLKLPASLYPQAWRLPIYQGRILTLETRHPDAR